MERAAGGAHGLPQLPARGDSSELFGDLGLAEDLQELGPWEEGGRAGCACLKAAAQPWLRGSWVRGVSPAPFCVWESWTTWGKFRAQPLPVWFSLWLEKANLTAGGRRDRWPLGNVSDGGQGRRGPRPNHRLLAQPRIARRTVPRFSLSV